MNPPIFKHHYKVYISHTDAGGIVYHANHLTFFEHCRRDWLTSLGMNGYFFDTNGQATGTDSTGDKIHFVVSHAQLSYKLPLLVDDVLVVTIDEVVKKSASLVMTQHIYRNDDDFANGKIASTGVITLACVVSGKDGIRPHRLPQVFL